MSMSIDLRHRASRRQRRGSSQVDRRYAGARRPRSRIASRPVGRGARPPLASRATSSTRTTAAPAAASTTPSGAPRRTPRTLELLGPPFVGTQPAAARRRHLQRLPRSACAASRSSQPSTRMIGRRSVPARRTIAALSAGDRDVVPSASRRRPRLADVEAPVEPMRAPRPLRRAAQLPGLSTRSRPASIARSVDDVDEHALPSLRPRPPSRPCAGRAAVRPPRPITLP